MGKAGLIQILPYGRHKTNKGEFVLDDRSMAGIIADFDSKANDMVIDYEHQTLGGGEAPAAGWIKKLIDKGGDGLWAVVQWTPRALGYLENREYRYLSPVFLKSLKDNRVLRLINAGLTNQPAIDGMAAIANKDCGGEAVCRRSIKIGKEDDVMERLMDALGLGEDATGEDALGVIAAMKESVKGMKAVKAAVGLDEAAGQGELTGAIAAMRLASERAEALGQTVAALKAKLAGMEADGIIEEAMKLGKIAPAQRDWAMDYAMADMEGFKVFVAKSPAIVPMDSVEAGIRHGAASIDGIQECVNKMLGIDADTFRKFNPIREG